MEVPVLVCIKGGRMQRAEGDWLTLTEGSKVYLLKRVEGGAEVKVVVDFTGFPEKIEVTIFRPGSGKLVDGCAYARRARRHTITLSPELQRRLRENECLYRRVFIKMMSELLIPLIAKRGSHVFIRGREVSIANVIASVLIRAGLAEKPYKIVDGKPKYGKYKEVLLDGRPLCGPRAYAPIESLRYKYPERFFRIRRILRKYIDVLKNVKNGKVEL